MLSRGCLEKGPERLRGSSPSSTAAAAVLVAPRVMPGAAAGLSRGHVQKPPGSTPPVPMPLSKARNCRTVSPTTTSDWFRPDSSRISATSSLRTHKSTPMFAMC